VNLLKVYDDETVLINKKLNMTKKTLIIAILALAGGGVQVNGGSIASAKLSACGQHDTLIAAPER